MGPGDARVRLSCRTRRLRNTDRQLQRQQQQQQQQQQQPGETPTHTLLSERRAAGAAFARTMAVIAMTSATSPVPVLAEDRAAVLLSLWNEEDDSVVHELQLRRPNVEQPAPPAAASPPVTPGCSPQEDNALQDATSCCRTELTAGAPAAAAQPESSTAAQQQDTATHSKDSPPDRNHCSPGRRKRSGDWQLVDDGDRIAALLVTGASAASPQPQREPSRSETQGMAEFGLAVQAEWHAQLESLIEMGYSVKAAADALGESGGDLMQAFKYLERRR